MSNWIIVNRLAGFKIDTSLYPMFKIIDETEVVSDVSILNEFVGKKSPTLILTEKLPRAVLLKKDTNRFRIAVIMPSLRELETEYEPFTSQYLNQVDFVLTTRGLKDSKLNHLILTAISNF